MIIYTETTLPLELGTLQGELESQGMTIRRLGITTRRKVNGVILKNQPRALVVEGDNLVQLDIDSVIAAHVPYFGNKESAVSRLRDEEKRRKLLIADEWRQRNHFVKILRNVLRVQAGQTLTVQQENQNSTALAEWQSLDDVDAKTILIESQINALTDAAAENFDVRNDILWI